MTSSIVWPNIPTERSEILSLTAAGQGWEVRVTHTENSTKTVIYERVFPVVAWAAVRSKFKDGEPYDTVEPVFASDDLGLIHAVEYRRWTREDSHNRSHVSIELRQAGTVRE